MISALIYAIAVWPAPFGPALCTVTLPGTLQTVTPLSRPDLYHAVTDSNRLSRPDLLTRHERYERYIWPELNGNKR